MDSEQPLTRQFYRGMGKRKFQSWRIVSSTTRHALGLAMSAFLEDYVRSGNPSHNHDSKELCRAFVVNSKQYLGAGMFGFNEFEVPASGQWPSELSLDIVDNGLLDHLGVSDLTTLSQGDDAAVIAPLVTNALDGPIYDESMLGRISCPNQVITTSSDMCPDADISGQGESEFFSLADQWQRSVLGVENQIQVTSDITTTKGNLASNNKSTIILSSGRQHGKNERSIEYLLDFRVGTMGPGPELGMSEPINHALPLPLPALNLQTVAQEAEVLRDFCAMISTQSSI